MRGGYLVPTPLGLLPAATADEAVELFAHPDLMVFRRIAFAASPVEVRLFDGRRLRGQERFPQVDADATGVP